MARRLPPLNQLRAFEAAARHLSFKAAAEELSVSHSAVSQHIRALEELLGRQLFQRVPGGVQLTEAAEVLSEDLTRALDRMNAAVDRFRSSDRIGTLRLSVVPWHGYRYLLPGLEGFRKAHAGLDLELHFSYETVDFNQDDFHAAMRHGSGQWEHLSAYRLNHDNVTPVCAPELVSGRDLPLPVTEITSLPLAVPRQQEENWRVWLSAEGISDLDGLNLEYFDNRALSTEWAMAGHGVSLSDVCAVHDELASGQLVRLHPHVARLETGLHLVFPPSPYPDSRLRLVADWMIDILPTAETVT